MITSQVKVSDASYGGKAQAACDVPSGIAFRLVPRDGLAAFPRQVRMSSGAILDVVDSSWMRLEPGVTGFTLAAAAMPLADLWATLNSGAPGFDVSNPPSETWTLQVATDECDLVAPAPQLPRVQTLWTVDAPAPGVGASLASPIFDSAPWRGILVSMLTTQDQAKFTVHGFGDINPNPAISRGLVLGAAAQYGQVDLATPAAAITKPAMAAVFLATDLLAAAASALGNVSVERLPPYVYGWHVENFGIHNRRVTFRGYR